MAERGRTGDTGRVGDTGRTGDTGEAGGVGLPGATGTTGPQGREGPRSGRGLLWTLVGAALLLIVIAAALSTAALLQQDNIETNTNRIARLSEKTAAIEARDTQRLREAAWRGCQRDQLERADNYAQTRAFLASGGSDAFSQEFIDKSIARRQKNLPIMDCDPNMCDRTATILPREKQDAFIAAYAAGRLHPNPQSPKVDCSP